MNGGAEIQRCDNASCTLNEPKAPRIFLDAISSASSDSPVRSVTQHYSPPPLISERLDDK